MARKMKFNDSLCRALEHRQTVRELEGGRLPAEYLDKLIWAGYGLTHRDGIRKLRTAPSAGATYPVEIHMAMERVDDYREGIYRFDTKSERPVLTAEGQFLKEICRVSLEQDFIPLSNAAFIMVYNPSKIVREYGRDSRKYALLECGHIAQNILLMATSLGLGSVPVGAFYPGRLGSILGLEKGREPLYMICVGTTE